MVYAHLQGSGLTGPHQNLSSPLPPSRLFLSVCVRAEETLRGADWPPSLVKTKNRSAARLNQSWHTTSHDTDAQVVFIILSRPGPVLFLLELIIDNFTDEHIYVPNTETVFFFCTILVSVFLIFVFFLKWCKKKKGPKQIMDENIHEAAFY